MRCRGSEATCLVLDGHGGDGAALYGAPDLLEVWPYVNPYVDIIYMQYISYYIITYINIYGYNNRLVLNLYI